jgi:hypothetical protein
MTTPKQRLGYIGLVMLLLLLLFCFWKDIHAQTASTTTSMGPIATPQVNSNLYVGQSLFPTIQSTVTYACTHGGKYAVVLLPGTVSSETITALTGGCTGTYVTDLRSLPAASYAWNGVNYTAVSSGGGGGGTPPGGPATSVQVNVSSTLQGYSTFTFDAASGTLTVPKINVSGPNHGFTIAAGTDPPGAAGSVVYTSDALNGYAEVNEAGTGRQRVCTQTNGVCPTGGSFTGPTQGFWSAMSSNTGGNTGGANGVSNIMANTSFQAQPAKSILMDPSYTEWDQSAMDTASGDRMSFFDARSGYFDLYTINPGPLQNTNSGFNFRCLATIAEGAPYGGAGPGGQSNCIGESFNIQIPGYSYGALYPGTPTGWYGETMHNIAVNNYSAAINKSLESAEVYNNGKGDQQIFNYILFNGYGGGDESAGEGNHVQRLVSTIGGSDFTGSLYSNGVDFPAQGYVQIYISNQHGGLGVRRVLLNLTNGVLTDTVTAAAGNADGSATLTMTNSTYSVSTVVTLTQDIQPPASSEQTKTSMTFTVNTGSALPGTVVGKAIQFVGGANSPTNPECALIKAVGTFSGGSQTVTAMLGEYHGNGSKAYIGGMACHYLVADSSIMTRTQNTWTTYFVAGSTANNKLIAYRLGQAFADPNIGGVGAVHIYTGAQVVDVRCHSSWCYNLPDDNVRVEETGAVWNNNDNVHSGMMSTALNESLYYTFADNNPMTQGTTLSYYLQGAQMGGYGPRNFMEVRNQLSENDYVTGGGPFNEGAVLNWIGPINHVFTMQNPIHGSFLSEFAGCDYTVVDSYQASLRERCPYSTGAGTIPSVSLDSGWEFDGDVVLHGDGNANNISAIFSFVHGNSLLATTIYPGTYTSALTLQASPYTPNPPLQVNSVAPSGSFDTPQAAFAGAISRGYTVAMPNRFPSIEPPVGAYGLTLSYDLINPAGGGAEVDWINSHWSSPVGGASGAGFAWYDVLANATGYRTTPIMRLTSAGDLTVHSLTCTGTPCGSGGGGGGGTLPSTTNLLAGDGSGGAIASGISKSGSLFTFPGQTNWGSTVMVSNDNGGGYGEISFNGSIGGAGVYAGIASNPGDPNLYFSVPSGKHYDFAVGIAIFHAGINAALPAGACTSGVALDAANNLVATACGAGILAGGIVLPAATPRTGTNCGTHPANALWADDSYVYHCNAAGTAIGRAALTSFAVTRNVSNVHAGRRQP